MTKKRAIIISVSLAIIYVVALSCFGVFGVSIAAWFMAWVPTFLKIVGITSGLFVVTVLPIRIYQAMELRKAKIEEVLHIRKLARAEAEQKKLDKLAHVSTQVNRYE